MEAAACRLAPIIGDVLAVLSAAPGLPARAHVGLRRDLLRPVQGLQIRRAGAKGDFARAPGLVGQELRAELSGLSQSAFASGEFAPAEGRLAYS